MLESLETSLLRRLCMPSVIVPGIRRSAAAACARDELFNFLWTNHSSVIADMHLIIRPVQVDIRNVRVATQCALDRLCAFDAMNIFEFERDMVCRV